MFEPQNPTEALIFEYVKTHALGVSGEKLKGIIWLNIHNAPHTQFLFTYPEQIRRFQFEGGEPFSFKLVELM